MTEEVTEDECLNYQIAFQDTSTFTQFYEVTTGSEEQVTEQFYTIQLPEV